MKVGIHLDPYGKFRDLHQKYEKILQYNNIECVRLEASQNDFWKTIPDLDLFIYNFIHYDSYERAKTILPIIENHYNVKCLPNQNTCWHYDDKIKQDLMLRANGFPTIDFWVFWEKKEALQWLKHAKFPLVFKLKGGSGSSSVILVKTYDEAKFLTNRMFGKGIIPSRMPGSNSVRFKYFNPYKEARHMARRWINRFNDIDSFPYWHRHKNYVYFQAFLPNNEYDTRVTTIGNRGFAFRRFVRKNDFRASGSDNWSLDRSKIDMEMVKIGMEVSKALDFQVMAYDFIYDEKGKPRIVEISYTYGDYPEFSTGYIDENLKWQDGNYWTQYLQLVDALNLPTLKQPKLEATGHYGSVNVSK